MDKNLNPEIWPMAKHLLEYENTKDMSAIQVSRSHNKKSWKNGPPQNPILTRFYLWKIALKFKTKDKNFNCVGFGLPL